jgi:hypothetical protein
MIDARVARLMAGRGLLSLTDVPVTDDEGYLWVIHMVAYGSDGASPYAFEQQRCGRPDCLDPECTICRTRRGPYVLPNGVLRAVGTTARTSKTRSAGVTPSARITKGER